MDFHWTRPDDQPPLAPSSFASKAKEALRACLEASGIIEGNRLAYVVSRFARSEAPALRLTEYFIRPELRDGPLNRPGQFQLHAHKVYQPEGMPEVNSWVRWKSAQLQGSKEPIIALEQDLNTLVSREDPIPGAEIESFLDAAPVEADRILQHYLAPGRGPTRGT
jgi:hypothetical protein